MTVVLTWGFRDGREHAKADRSEGVSELGSGSSAPGISVADLEHFLSGSPSNPAR